MAHRTRNITVEAFLWFLFELLYGLYSLYDEELMVSINTCDAAWGGGGGKGGTGTKTAFTLAQSIT